MKITHIPFQQTGFFSKTMIDYLENKESIQPFFHNFPNADGFFNQLNEKNKSFSKEHRKALVEVLKDQYGFKRKKI